MNRVLISALLLFSLLPPRVEANDYASATNIVIRGWVPWRIAVFLINEHVAGVEERWRAVSSLVQYKSAGLVPYLKVYTNDPSGPVRVAAFWPLYKNGEQAFAIGMLRREIEKGNTSAVSAFFTPNTPGSEYKLELSRNDQEFKHFVEETAINKKIDLKIRIFAAIHLTQINKKEIAGRVAKEILAGIAPEPGIKNYNDWPEASQNDFHVRRHAEWCLHMSQP